MGVNGVSGMRQASSVTAVLLRIVTLCMLLSATGCAWLDTRQRQIIYRPTPASAGEVAGLRPGDERYFLDVTEGGTAQRIALWWLPHATQNAPTMLYLHGTFRDLRDNLPKIDALRDAGFAVLAVDYRGWGHSTPITPSEQTIMHDARLAWAELERREPRPAQRVIYGHSMGSGVAVDLASKLASQSDYGALILESAFTSFSDVAREAGVLATVLAWFGNERFASIGKIASVQAPLLMIHGTRDATIPVGLGQRLFAAANAPKQWLGIEGGDHSNLNQVASTRYQQALQAFRRQYLSQPE